MSAISECFGSMVFDERVMKSRLTADVYYSLKETIRREKQLDLSLANAVASAMRDWAVEKGATHFTHWFQPLTGITAEKHDSFISPSPDGGVIMDFSGKELIQGEPDASSFPSGGLRATFEARGYTAWDPTSYAFIKDSTLYIPTAFCSYGGEALDKKTPLLRSMEALSRQALRILRLFGNKDATRVNACAGPEQEYFLIPKELFEKRKDLVYTGRTLFGEKPPKGQELSDHYFGAIKPKVAAFMADLDRELWKLGILAKTEHNEVAPAQHELAPVYTTVNRATDHNQLTMGIMQNVAERHGLVCLLHEKPFAGVNGSGKHNNWSLSTDTGVNLLSPGETPHENAQFLLYLCAILKAVDKYQDLLRMSVASAGNDHRLGANEAPPAVISVFLGDELTAILEAVEKEKPYSATEKQIMRLGVHALPRFTRDTTDRNRTSPFAFTGNKFEFRMPGSSASIADANTVLNAAVASVLEEFADKLEKAKDFNAALHTLIKRTVASHKRIIFNGNGYDDAWIREAVEERGLCNLNSTPDSLVALLDKKNIDMLTSQKVLSRAEILSRHEIMLENYCKTIFIEARTMVDMARKEILPAVEAYIADLVGTACKKTMCDISDEYEKSLLRKLTHCTKAIDSYTESLEKISSEFQAVQDMALCAQHIKKELLPAMERLRSAADEAEHLTGARYWPFPTYGDLLYGIQG